jgi:hypothetical protein
VNAGAIRQLIAEHDLSGLEALEQDVFASMDDEANDVAELGDRLTNILGAKRILEQAQNEGIEPKVAMRNFFKDVRNIIG